MCASGHVLTEPPQHPQAKQLTLTPNSLLIVCAACCSSSDVPMPCMPTLAPAAANARNMPYPRPCGDTDPATGPNVFRNGTQARDRSTYVYHAYLAGTAPVISADLPASAFAAMNLGSRSQSPPREHRMLGVSVRARCESCRASRRACEHSRAQQFRCSRLSSRLSAARNVFGLRQCIYGLLRGDASQSPGRCLAL